MASTSFSEQSKQPAQRSQSPLRYYGGIPGALAPFLFFVAGVITLALSGAQDERGFWPILVGALTLGLLLARDRKAYCEAAVQGMSQPLLAIMILAWTLASVIGVLMSATGFVEALIWCASQMQLGGAAFVAASFLICCLVSASTGTSFGTILICGPILYPAGGILGADLALLAGAILGGATFGDSISPISDTTIASALSQNADIGGTVRSRLKYVLPAAAAALALFGAVGALVGSGNPAGAAGLSGDPRGLPMILVPLVVLMLLLRGRHLLHGLLIG
ncbi:MAG: Na+/H+ antiporter NhaC family protein, partial [Acidobacteriota bacterium]